MNRHGYFANEGKNRSLMAAISAKALGRIVGYGLKDDEAYGYIPMRPAVTGQQVEGHAERILHRYSTHFFDVILPRTVSDKAFSMEPRGKDSD